MTRRVTPLPFGCAKCDNRWSGYETAHCGSCHVTCTGLEAFDQHLCHSPAAGMELAPERAYDCYRIVRDHPAHREMSAVPA